MKRRLTKLTVSLHPENPFGISSGHIPIFPSLLWHLANALQNSYTLSGVQKENRQKQWFLNQGLGWEGEGVWGLSLRP